MKIIERDAGQTSPTGDLQFGGLSFFEKRDGIVLKDSMPARSKQISNMLSEFFATGYTGRCIDPYLSSAFPLGDISEMRERMLDIEHIEVASLYGFGNIAFAVVEIPAKEILVVMIAEEGKYRVSRAISVVDPMPEPIPFVAGKELRF